MPCVARVAEMIAVAAAIAGCAALHTGYDRVTLIVDGLDADTTLNPGAVAAVMHGADAGARRVAATSL